MNRIKTIWYQLIADLYVKAVLNTPDKLFNIVMTKALDFDKKCIDEKIHLK